MPVMVMPEKVPFHFPFGTAWRASRKSRTFALERLREDSSSWEQLGLFDSPREAKRALRDLSAEHPGARSRIRPRRSPGD